MIKATTYKSGCESEHSEQRAGTREGHVLLVASLLPHLDVRARDVLSERLGDHRRLRLTQSDVAPVGGKEGSVYLMTHSTHFIYGFEIPGVFVLHRAMYHL